MTVQPENLRADIVKVIAKLENPENWTKYVGARDNNDNVVRMFSDDRKEICKWCLWGAIVSNRDKRNFVTAPRFMKLAAEVIKEKFSDRLSDLTDDYYCITDFNDHSETTHDEVMSVLMECSNRAGCENTLFSNPGFK